MTREDALLMLNDESPHARVKAARHLRKEAAAEDLPALQTRRRQETVSYVRDALDAAINSTRDAGRGRADADETTEIPDDLRRELRADAVRWIAGLLLHELSSPIGLVELSATQEIPDYDHSQTKVRITATKRVFEAIELLKNAATGARRESFDLAKLIEEVVYEERQNRRADITVHGPKPMITNADPSLLRLALSNGLRNAFDATEAVAQEGQKVVITWGQTDVNHWISVIDSGVGLTHSPERAFEVGRSTKRNHSGFGLAIARQAMETLGGSANIEPANGFGARYELLWES